MDKSLTFKVIRFLALLQGVLGCCGRMIGCNSVSIFLGRDALLLPFVGTVAVIRGLFISAVAPLCLLLSARYGSQKKFQIPGSRKVVAVAEGDFEPRSVGSYALRLRGSV